MSYPTLVVSAYNRPAALERLLNGLRAAAYPPGEVRLVISVDAEATPEQGRARAAVVALARQAAWPFGPKDVIDHTQHLGPLGHVFFCGGLSRDYGDLIFLEDDFIVSPAFYVYSAQALDFYRRDDRIACLSLYALWFNGYTHEPFVPLPDESAAFFLQVPFFQGLAFTPEGWARFAGWRAEGDERPRAGDPLHDLFLRFPADDYYPVLAKYVATTGRWVVYPRVGVCTGMGDPGVHFPRATAFFPTPLQRAPEHYRFRSLDDSWAVYDSFFEILPDRLARLAPNLAGLDCDVDLYATKSPRHLRCDWVLTSRPCRAPLRTFGRTLWPHEANLIDGVPGFDLALCRRQDLRWGWWADLEARRRNHRYFTRGRGLGWRRALLYGVLDRLGRARR